MLRNKKTAPDVASIESGTGKTESVAAPGCSPAHHIMSAPPAQGIASILPRGTENAVSSEELMQHCGVSSVRKLRAIIAEERAAGALILSNTTGGYFLPDYGAKGREEMVHFVSTVRSKALALLCAARPARAALQIVEGQEKIDQSEAL